MEIEQMNIDDNDDIENKAEIKSAFQKKKKDI